MRYRTLGRTGLQVSEIGLGTEFRVPRTSAQMAAILSAAAEAGVNFLDLLYVHEGYLKDFGPAFRPHKDTMQFIAHWGSEDKRLERDQSACRRNLDAVFKALGRDQADVLLLMMIDRLDEWETWGQEALDRVLLLKQQGLARSIGLSTHNAAVGQAAVASGLVDVIMFAVNLASHAVAANPPLYAACEAAGVGVVAMKPFAGGQLLRPEANLYIHWILTGGEILQLHKSAPITPTHCLSYALSQPAVATTVPCVQDLAELRSALHYLEATPAERDYSGLISHFEHFIPGVCVYCNHCLPCPAEIDIAAVLRLADSARAGLTPDLRAAYAALPRDARDCQECRACIERCPYDVDVVARLVETATLFG